MEHQHSLKQTILTLASMLADCSEEREQSEKECKDIQADLRALQISYEDTQDALIEERHNNVFLRQENSDLRAKSTPSYLDTIETRTHKEQHSLLLSLFQRPEVWEALHSYMQGEGQQKWDTKQKITIIKEVRDITRWGLLEAKNFVESYHWAPPPTASLEEALSGQEGNPTFEEGCTHHTSPIAPYGRVGFHPPPETNEGG